MRLLGCAVVSAVLFACQRPVEVSGLYVSDHGPGDFLSCDQPKAVVLVSDSTLAAKYRVTATEPYQQVFVRLRGVPVDSGSTYGSAHYFLVQQVIEVRPRRAGECPTRANPLPSMLPRSRPGPPAQRLRRPGGDQIHFAGGGHALVRVHVRGPVTEGTLMLPQEPTQLELNPLESVLAEVKTEGWH
jgi:hypothetical protein